VCTIRGMSGAVIEIRDIQVSGRTLTTVGWLCLVVAVVAGVSFVCLVLMFILFALGENEAGQLFGRTNDWLGLVSSVLALPIVVVLGRLLYATRPLAGLLITAVGTGAFAAIVILSWLLVSDTWTFEQQIGPVSAAYVVLMGWFVVTGRRMATTGFLRHGLPLGIGAALYAGFPVWAFAVGRRLIRLGRVDGQP
jgi:hypothetical protein